MRREIFRGERARAIALLGRAPYVHLATTTPEGAPVLRALDAVVIGEAVWFHGARAGEKSRCLGRPAVVSAEELVTHVASWMVHPTSACPASTFYRSVQVHGPLVEATAPAEKARVLEALMQRWQPEGRYRSIAPDDPEYRGELRGTLVLGVPFERVDGKEKLGQNRPPEELRRILEGLWARGGPGDVEAIEAIRAASPGLPAPPLLAAGDGVTLHAALGPEDEAGAVALLRDTYWWAGQDPAAIAPAQRASSAWIGARAPDGRLVATARAQADGRCAWLYDVVVAPDHRGRGLGARLVAFLLDHPAVRACPTVKLRTRDAERLYARLGFAAADDRAPASSRELVLVRGAPPR